MRSLLALSIACCLTACNGGSDPSDNVTAVSEEERLLADPRIDTLLFDCERSEYFGENTSDLLPALVGKLAKGQRDPLRGARRDLAAMGDRALEELTALADAELASSVAPHVLLNVLGVVAMMDAPHGRELALRCADSGYETVRLAAVRALEKRARPEDYERVSVLLPTAGLGLAVAIVETLAVADPERFIEDLSSWVEAGTQREVWAQSSQALIPHTEVDERACAVARIAAGADPVFAMELYARLRAMCARAGDEDALASLTKALESEKESVRSFALHALIDAGLGGELYDVLANDEAENLRALAAVAISEREPTPKSRAALVRGLADESDSVRGACLAGLLNMDEPEAVDFALATIERGGAEARLALEAARNALKRNAELRARVLSVLEAVFEARADQTPSELGDLVQFIGQIPSREAAEILLDFADRAEGEIERIRARRWITLQAGNTGEAGRAVVLERWRTETDPIRRLDLLAALYADKKERTRDALLEGVTREGLHPFEILFAADLVVRVGPAEDVAPVLKRVALRCNHPQVRPALQCLLWRFYG